MIITYVAEEVLEVVASGIVVGVQHSGVQVLLLMVSLPVVELLGTIIQWMHSAFKKNKIKKIYIYIAFINLFHIKIYVIHFEGLFTHLTGPCVTQDSSHVNRGVCHNGVIVEFLFGLIPVFELWKDIEK